MKKYAHMCLNCEAADMKKETRDIQAQYKGLSRTVPAVFGWHCPNCGEVEFLSKGDGARYSAAVDELAEELNRMNSAALRSARKRLKLTQQQAAELTGGGHNAFSRYERGEAQPMAAVVNLFKLLDKHPELLKELHQSP